MKTVAVILAGGTGVRMGMATPKQLLKVAGKTVLEHTLSALHDCPEVDEILIVMAQGYLDRAEEIVHKGAYKKVAAILPGGSDRTHSTLAALEHLGDIDCKVLFHDAVRPFVSRRIVTECVEALDTYNAVDTAIESADTIIEVDEADRITSIPPRARLRRGQTPQGFRLPTLRKAYDLALQRPDFAATDDCTVVLQTLPDEPIYVVRGAEENMKLTQAVDIFIADKLFQLRAETIDAPQSPEDYRGLLEGKTIVVFGGSYGIGHDILDLCKTYGADTFSFSRTETGTHIEDPNHIEKALQQAYGETGRIDYVVLTAAILTRGWLAEMTDEDIEHQIRVNFAAPVYVARASARYLTETKGQLLLFTSSSYTRGRAEYSLYSSTKAAIVNLTQALSDEWSDLGIRVNCINPERTKTPMRVRAFGEEPDHTLLTSHAVALASVNVLVSDLTGQVIDVRRPEADA